VSSLVSIVLKVLIERLLNRCSIGLLFMQNKSAELPS